MQEGRGRHAELMAELAVWQEDLWLRHKGSQVVLVKVPAGWGRQPGITGDLAQIPTWLYGPGEVTVVRGSGVPCGGLVP
jgi:hypothetical protein